MARVVEIASFYPPKKAKSVIFFQVTWLLFLNAGFMIETSEVSSKNNFRFLVKPSTENLLLGEHFLL